jgi:hypothetical protein
VENRKVAGVGAEMLYYIERFLTYAIFMMLFIAPFIAGYFVGKWVERERK